MKNSHHSKNLCLAICIKGPNYESPVVPFLISNFLLLTSMLKIINGPTRLMQEAW